MGKLNSLKQWLLFSKLPASQRRYVFYSEGPAYWPHIGPVAEALADQGVSVCYLTSSLNDPGLSHPSPYIHSFYMGRSMICTMWLMTMRARMLIMTMPDLQLSYVRRSPHVKHYSYLFHAATSMHSYHISALDHFDSILCAGPHHMREIREIESTRKLAPKALYEHGYTRLDGLMKNLEAIEHKTDEKCILIAPTWGVNSLLRHDAGSIIDILLSDGYRVILRPHPQSLRVENSILSTLKERYTDRIEWDIDHTKAHGLLESSLMITDISGVMIDYAFAYRKPVIRIATPLDFSGCEHGFLTSPLIEESLCAHWEAVVAVNDIVNLSRHIKKLLGEWPHNAQIIEQLRQQTLYNIGKTAACAANILRKIENSL